MLGKLGMKKTFILCLLLSIITLIAIPAYSAEPQLFKLDEPLKVDLQVHQLSMQDAIKLALLNNPTVRIEELKLQEKHWDIKENQSYLYPQVYVGQDFVVSNNPVQAFMIKLNQRNLAFSPGTINNPGTESNFATRIGGDWSLLDREQYKKVDLSKLELEIQKQLGREDLDKLVFNVRKAYYDVKLAQSRLEAANSNHSYANAHFKLVNEKKEVGSANKGELLGAKAQLSVARESVSNAKNTLNLSWITLSDILGEDEVVGYDLVDEMKNSYSIDAVDNLVKYAYLHRPDIAAVDNTKKKSVINLKLAKASGALTIKAHGEWGVDTILDDRDIAQSFTAGVFLRKPIFDGGLRRAKIKKAESEISRREAEIEQVYSKAKVEVVQNYLAFKNAEERLSMTNDVVSDSEESLRAYNERYSAGLSSNVEVESAASKLANSRMLRTHAIYDLNVSFISLQKAIGMPLQDLLSSGNINVSKVDNIDNIQKIDNEEVNNINNVETNEQKDELQEQKDEQIEQKSVSTKNKVKQSSKKKQNALRKNKKHNKYIKQSKHIKRSKQIKHSKQAHKKKQKKQKKHRNISKYSKQSNLSKKNSELKFISGHRRYHKLRPLANKKDFIQIKSVKKFIIAFVNVYSFVNWGEYNE